MGDVGEIVAALQDGADCNAADDTGKTPLMHAATSGQSEAVEALLSTSARVHERDSRRHRTALHFACFCKTSQASNIVALLLAAGSSVDDKEHYGWTPLMAAAYRGQLASVQLLLAAGADFEDTDKHGLTPLMLSARGGSPLVVATLLDLGACAATTSNFGATALSLGCGTAGHADVVRLLLRAGDYDFHLRDLFGRTALDLAVDAEDVDALCAMLGAGALV
jgi:ankyrin repeat protein